MCSSDLGARSIEEKEYVLRKRKRGLQWRRVLLSLMTLLSIVVMLMVIVNSFIFLEPGREEVAFANPSTPTAGPAGLNGPVTPSAPGGYAPTPSPRPTETPNLTPDTKSEATPTPPLHTLSPTPTPSSTPSPAPTPTPTPTPTSTPTTSPSPKPECSDDDKNRERESIIQRYGETWRRNIEGERSKIIARNGPDGTQNTEASLGGIEYTSTFLKACKVGIFTARYAWQVTTYDPEGKKVVTVRKEKTFTCGKIGGAWICS